MARLVLVCGLPGSGKTTIAGRIALEMPALQLIPDRWLADLGFDGWDGVARERVEALQWSLAQDLLRLGQNVTMESGFWSRSERDSFRIRARGLGAAVELRFLDVPVEELRRRLDVRAEAHGTYRVTPAQLAEMVPFFEPPDEAELSLFDDPC